MRLGDDRRALQIVLDEGFILSLLFCPFTLMTRGKGETRKEQEEKRAASETMSTYRTACGQGISFFFFFFSCEVMKEYKAVDAIRVYDWRGELSGHGDEK